MCVSNVQTGGVGVGQELWVKHKLSRKAIHIRIAKGVKYIVNDRIGHAGGESGRESCGQIWRVHKNELECIDCGTYASEVSGCTCKTQYCKCGLGEDRGRGIQKRWAIE